MKKVLMVLFLVGSCLLLSGCMDQVNAIKEINFSELKERIDNKESFILEVMQTGCSHCEEFSPRLRSILSENNLTGYSINLSNLEKGEQEELEEIVHISGTPTLLFFTNGELETAHKVVGAASNNVIKGHLKDLNYIEK